MTDKKIEIGEDYLRSCFSRNEAGDADLFARLHLGKVLWCSDLEHWMAFANHHWQEDQTKFAESLVEGVASEYEMIMPGKKEDIEMWRIFKRRINRLRSVAGIRNTLELSKMARDPKTGAPLMTVTSAVFNRDTTRIACPTGVINLKNGQLRDGQPDDYITLFIPTPFLSVEQPSPTCDGFMEQIFPDAALRHYMQKVIGSALLGLRREHFAYVLLGSGRNGKSALVEELRRALGDEICTSVPASLFMEQRFQSTGPTPEMMALSGTRLVFGAELPGRSAFDTAKLKLATGGDTIAARYGYAKKQSTFQPKCTLFLACNSVPHCSGDDAAGMDRLRIIDFVSKVVMDRPPRPDSNEIAYDPDLEKKFATERSGTLAWIVRGGLLYLREGLTPPKSVLDRGAEYVQAEDVLGMWLADRQDTSSSGWTAATPLHDDFCLWAEKTRTCKPWGSKTFFSDLKKRVKYKAGARCKEYEIILQSNSFFTLPD
ncbi:MAG: phage/plasmid primase, P4 family [Desulfuromonas sp.]|nr:phage/plasmid primase, P4 family [Desulfuromonas sp.]